MVLRHIEWVAYICHMEINDIQNITSHLLKVSSPWIITKIDLQQKNKVIDIFIDFEKGSQFCCSECKNNCTVYDRKVHRWRYLDWFDHRCYLNVQIPRTECPEHGIKIISSNPWGRLDVHYSYLFENMIMRYVAEMSMSAVSRELGEPDNNLWRVFNYHIKNAIDNQLDLSKVKRVAVDEKSQKKGHTYVTIFTDLDEGNVILVKLGRKKEVFEDFKKWLVEKNGLSENIELFSMDMSVSYKAGREEFFPKSEEVYDHFHIKKALNEAVDNVRKEEVKYIDDLKKTKYIWLKNPQRLTEGQERKLNDFLNESSMETAIAYKMKTAFDQLWKVHPTKAEPLLENWLHNALISQLKPFVKFVNTVRNNYKGIVKSIKTNITNAIAEGINSKVQIAKSRARGFRSMDSFMAMIYFLGNDFKFNTC